MFDLGIAGAAVALDNRPFLTPLNQLPGQTQSVMARVQGIVTRALGAYGVYRTFKTASTASMDFGAELSNIRSIATDFNLDSLKHDILDIDSILGRSTELANSYYYAYSSGARGSEAELAAFTARVAKMAKTIRAEQIPAMDSLTTLMNGYNLTIKDAGMLSDWFYTVVKLGKTTGQEVAATLGLVVDSASQAHVPIKQLGAAIATLTRTQPTSRAMTSLNQVIVSFLDPSKEAIDTARELGIELSATAIREKGFAAAIGEINEKAGDNVEALAKMFGNVRAFRAAASLAGSQAETFQKILKQFDNNAGSSLKAFEIQTNNAKTTWTTAMTDMNKGLINFGDAISPAVSLLGGLIGATGKAIAQMPDWKVQLGLVAVAINVIRGHLARTAAESIQAASAAGSYAVAEKSAANATDYGTAAISRQIGMFTQQEKAALQAGTGLMFFSRSQYVAANQYAQWGKAFNGRAMVNFAKSTSVATNQVTKLSYASRTLGASKRVLSASVLELKKSFGGLGNAMSILNLAAFAPAVWDIGYAFGNWLDKVGALNSALDTLGGYKFEDTWMVRLFAGDIKEKEQISSELDKQIQVNQTRHMLNWKKELVSAGKISEKDADAMISDFRKTGKRDVYKKLKQLYNDMNKQAAKAKAEAANENKTDELSKLFGIDFKSFDKAKFDRFQKFFSDRFDMGSLGVEFAFANAEGKDAVNVLKDKVRNALSAFNVMLDKEADEAAKKADSEYKNPFQARIDAMLKGLEFNLLGIDSEAIQKGTKLESLEVVKEKLTEYEASFRMISGEIATIQDKMKQTGVSAEEYDRLKSRLVELVKIQKDLLQEKTAIGEQAKKLSPEAQLAKYRQGFQNRQRILDRDGGAAGSTSAQIKDFLEISTKQEKALYQNLLREYQRQSGWDSPSHAEQAAFQKFTELMKQKQEKQDSNTSEIKNQVTKIADLLEENQSLEGVEL